MAIAVAVAAGLGGAGGSRQTLGTKGAVVVKAKKQNAGPIAAKKLEAARAQDRKVAVEDAQGAAGSGTKAAPSGTWRLGSVGTYLVGRGIDPGTYKSAAPKSGSCQWSRLKGFSGAPKDIIAQKHTTGPSVVTIKASDKFFLTSGCENWHRIR